ncbi:serine protease SP24D-like [Teleopsis dalmanni]|uniref:serine protease SP24D-like n=1 Tax=Teleopsis dalmanni TaxID=139649 RepID=UPI0018CD1196|nr:serine protease SP24D-like [Teleopsis dalmanni]
MKTFLRSFYLLAAILTCSASPQGRITGGDDAVLGQVPYQASLTIGGSPNCGAVILSDRYALTLLSCVCSKGSDKPWPPQLFRVTAGSIDLYTGGVSIVVEEITINPNYSELSTGIALLKLTEAFVFSANIQPIPLANDNPIVGEDVEVSGWGRLTETDEYMQRTLQINAATIVNSDECSRVIGKSDNQVICLGHPRKNGICSGDYGGPAVYQGELIGIAAYIVGECGSYLPDVYASIPFNYEWITEKISA